MTMKPYKVTLTENITGTAEVVGLDKEHAERIALAALADDGLAAFPDFIQSSREVDVGEDDEKEIPELH